MPDQSVLFKRLLGAELRMLRQSRELSLGDAGTAVQRAELSVRRWENGQALIDPLYLEKLVETYGAPEETRKRLDSLHNLASQPVWWSHLGPRPQATAGLLSMEGVASRIRAFDLAAMPGLLQTPAYARDVMRSANPSASAKQLDIDVQLRMERQSRVWDRAGDDDQPPPSAIFLLDEAPLRRMRCETATWRAQLGRLVTLPPSAVVQVVPLDAGINPSMGPYVILDLALDERSDMKGVYVEGAAGEGGHISEVPEEIQKYEQVFERTREIALNPAESARFIRNIKDGRND